MHRRSHITALVGASLCVMLASFSLTSLAGASTPLASGVSQTPVTWTPNVSAGPPPAGQKAGCNPTFFGPAALSCISEVYSTAFVNGEIIVAGAFTQVCQAASGASHCAAGTTVTRKDIFAYTPATGVIDPNFTPTLGAGPVWKVLAGPPGSNTVYVGGAFTTVDGTTNHHGLVQLNVNPDVSSGKTADGSIVTAFTGHVSSQVYGLALSPDSTALYVGGQFTSVDNATKFTNGDVVGGLARLNATTGQLDESFTFTLSDQITGLANKVETMALSSDGSHLAIAGTALKINGTSRPRLAIIDTGGALGAHSSLAAFMAPILTNNCSAHHDYIQGVDFSPDGTFIAIADTGATTDHSTPFALCDAAARFDINSADTAPSGTVDVAPAWINYAGEDSFYSIAIAGGVVYTGGHNRWVNNQCGHNYVCEANAVLVAGVAALDANTGLALPWWHPLTLRGHGTTYVATFPAGTYDGANGGLVQGTDVNSIAGAFHSENAIFPIAPPTAANPGGPIPSGMFNEDGGTSTKTPTCVDDKSNSSSPGNPVDSTTCSNDPQQNWTVKADGTIGINGLCLGTKGNGTSSGTAVELSSCSAGATVQWTQGAGNRLVNGGGTNECLTVPGGKITSGTALQIQTCSGSTSQAWPLPAALGPPSPPPVGEIYPQTVQTNDQVPCLDDTNNAHPVELQTCTGAAEQRWTVANNGTIQINGLCLDSSGTKKGTVPAVLNTCSGSASQQWTAAQSYELRNTGSTSLNGTPYCLVDPGGSPTNGTQLQVSACTTTKSGQNAESFRLPAE